MKLAPTSSSLQHQRVLGIMFILISAAAFGAAPIFAKYAYEYGTEPLTLMFLRFTLASGIMLIYTFLKQKITPLEIIALILALIGMVCVAGIETGGKPLGIILGVLAAIIYSIYIITGSRIMSNTNIIASSTVIMMSAGAVYTVAILIRGTKSPTQTAGWGAIGGIFFVGFGCWFLVTAFQYLK